MDTYASDSNGAYRCGASLVGRAGLQNKDQMIGHNAPFLESATWRSRRQEGRT
jgi:hypothetical protein